MDIGLLVTQEPFDKSNVTVKDANKRLRQLSRTATDLSAGDIIYLPILVITPGADKAALRAYVLSHPDILEAGAGIELVVAPAVEWPADAGDVSVVMTGKLKFVPAPPE